ncbi:carboxylesterase/lipase family protein [Asticcacaulis solisilvae]|uniref:carboxylesterase/lipase family protein n=1 Tax=Asticcacaulis solisilvae TaxID=1217274 RepID=UPI003FD7402D
MKKIIMPLLATLALAAASATAAPIRVEGGLINGAEKDGVKTWFGVPYAAPPVGQNRWRAPQPVVAWAGVKDTTAFSPACRQTATWIPKPQSEDCLYLNIWAPKAAKGQRLPVMVWIHGGGYYGGTGSQAGYDGASLTRRGVIVVTINYRLGIFGFFSHPELAAEGKVDGNQGLLDQVSALKWVKKNIAAFGGDPSRVTIFGESAGGESVAVLTTSPLARGLFQRAIAESGNMAMPIDAREYHWFDRAKAEADGLAAGKALGAPHLADLRKLDTETVIAQAWSPRPVVDNYLIPADMTAAYGKGLPARVPLLVGWNADEGKDLAPEILGTSDFTLARYPALVETLLGHTPLPGLLDAYPAKSDTEAKAEVNRLTTDYWGWRMWQWAKLHRASKSGPAYVYEFVHVPAEPATPCGYGCGAGHGAEIQYAFDQLAQDRRQWTADDRQLADRMATYWTNFAKTGNPNGTGVPAWPAFDGKASVIRLGSDAEVKAAPALPDYHLIDAQP